MFFRHIHVLGIILFFALGVRPAFAQIERGSLDLRHFDFSQHSSIRLDGEWAFAFGHHVAADEPFPSEEDRSAEGYPAWSSVPRHWGKLLQSSGLPLPQQGIATYRLNIALPKSNPPLALRVQSPATSSELYVNGVRLGGLGQVGDSPLVTKAQLGTILVPLDPQWRELEIRLVVSNWDGTRGGFWKPMELGKATYLRWSEQVSVFIRMFLAGAMCLMAFYHGILFFYRRKDNIHLIFGTFAFIGFFRILIPGDHLIRHIFPWISYHAIIRIEFATLLLAVGMIFNFLREFYPQLVSIRISRSFMIVGGLYTIYALFVPFDLLAESVNFTQIVNMVGGTWVLYYAFRAWKAKLHGSDLLFASIVLLYVAVINDILQSKQIVHTGYWVSYALFFLVFVQWILLAQRYSTAFRLLSTQREQFLMTMADTIESKDQYTGGHVNRVASFSRDLALAQGMPKDQADELYFASMAHDVGKIGIRDEILNKPGKFTDDEMEIMKGHAFMGYTMLKPLEDGVLAAEIAHFHQERWNGSGYPMGLSGEDIPLHARIVAVADYWDAISSDRPYRKAFPLQKSVSIILEEWGKGLDPTLVEIFLRQGIWVRYLQKQPEPNELNEAESLIATRWSKETAA